jgi:tetratricopeptide (TPR) repeat protein
MDKFSIRTSRNKTAVLSLLLLGCSVTVLAETPAADEQQPTDPGAADTEISDTVIKSFSLGLIAREKMRQLKTYLQDRKEQAARAAYELGVNAVDRGAIEEAYEYINEAIMLDPDHLQYLQAGVELAFMRDDYDRAERLQKQAIDLLKTSESTDPRQLSMLLDNLGTIYAAQELYRRAVGSFEESLAVREEGLGSCNLLVAVSLNKLATLAVQLDEPGRAEALLKRSLTIAQKVSGPDHANSAAVMSNLAELYQQASRNDEAEAMYLAAIDIWNKSSGEDPMRQVIGQNALGRLYLGEQRYEEARVQFEQVLALLQRYYESDHPYVQQALSNLGVLDEELGNQTQIENMYDALVREFNLQLQRHDALTATMPAVDSDSTPQ